MDGHRARSDSINMSTQFPASTSGGHDVSPPLRVAASDLTQSSVADASDSNSPPSTSSSLQFGTDPGASSSTNSQVDQPRSLSQLQATSFSRPLERVDSGHDTISSTPFYSPPSSRGVVQLTPGQKRTASGSMKCSVSPDRPFSALTTPGARYHSRSASTDSHSSRIAEISAQLRSKLSWAAAKVEKDWKSNPNSKQFSLSSKTHSPRGINASIRPNGHPPSSQPPRISGSVGERDLAAQVLKIATGHSNPRPDMLQSKPLNSSSRSYHRHNLSMGSIPSKLSYERSTSNGLHQIPRLAPPADIIPGNGPHTKRRVNQNSTSPKKLKVPSLSQQSSSSSVIGTQGSCPIPATPPQPHQPSFKAPSSATTAILGRHCTPTEKTIMEQDAVETLVFMGSPENSGYYNDSRPHTNPPSNSQDSFQYPPVTENTSAPTSSAPPKLGVAFNYEPRERAPLQSKRVSFAEHSGEAPHANCSRPRLEQNAGDEIDRLLDEMGDSDNEPDYDWFAHMSGARDNFNLSQQNQWTNDQCSPPSSAIRQPGNNAQLRG
ncbi:hypothetical protein H109_07946 [Trichophyton interdigitale MR816]|uniref:Uncharacterized protein n=1 Tax=Trichophyton interdigitale (strain MR816) TaxID=1215338 RepID=A0A059IX22_TRIIM|nr:hypothetical protein H101_02613 [Trichophyton interdigitale H6]KDB20084.1 hypothetical protein H109_07946 [Trichophyton interdigitale MR816]